jgi:hypothetical protein
MLWRRAWRYFIIPRRAELHNTEGHKQNWSQLLHVKEQGTTHRSVTHPVEYFFSLPVERHCGRRDRSAEAESTRISGSKLPKSVVSATSPRFHFTKFWHVWATWNNKITQNRRVWLAGGNGKLKILKTGILFVNRLPDSREITKKKKYKLTT